MIGGKRCPYCREKIKRDAVVCRYCHRELSDNPDGRDGSGAASTGAWLIAASCGLLFGGIAALGWALFKERQRWQEEIDYWRGDEG